MPCQRVRGGPEMINISFCRVLKLIVVLTTRCNFLGLAGCNCAISAGPGATFR
jgi:hypothetical protein